MGDTVKPRPNHYELLGLTPAASADEIKRAFARQLGLIPVRPFGWLAHISVAYETLRDPAKREAYHAEHFPKPAPAATGHPVFSQLFRPAPAEPPAKAVASPFLAARPSPDPSERWKPAPLAPITFRQPQPAASPAPPAPAGPEEMVRRAIREERGREAPSPTRPPLLRSRPDNGVADADARADWKVPAMAAGALVLALGGGAWIGLESGNDNVQIEPERIATLKVPPARLAPAVEAAPPAASTVTEARPEPRAPAPVAVAPVERARAPLEIELPQDRAEAASPNEAPPDDAAAEPLAAEVPGGAAVAAKFPLPDATVARTIRRIGYPCGQVASTTATESAGVFKVTCTSGHSYRAAPVRGRYRFKRLGG